MYRKTQYVFSANQGDTPKSVNIQLQNVGHTRWLVGCFGFNGPLQNVGQTHTIAKYRS